MNKINKIFLLLFVECAIFLGLTFHNSNFKIIITNNEDKLATKFTVTFYTNGGNPWTSKTCTSANKFIFNNSKSTCKKQVTNKKTYGELPVPTREGYIFLGWYTAKTGGSKITSSSKTSTSVKKLYARWEASSKYSLTLIGNGATLENGNSTQTLTCSTNTGTNSCSIKLPKIVRNGFEIIGWSVKSNAKNEKNAEVPYSKYTHYNPGDHIVLTPDMPKVTLYAITKKSITITFETPDRNLVLIKTNEGEIASERAYCTIYNSEKTCPVKTPELLWLRDSKYQIMGWDTDIASEKPAASYTRNTSSTLNVANSGTYYIVTRKKAPLTATFNVVTYIGLNGSKSEIDEIAKTQECYLYAGYVNWCKVTAPVLPPVTRSGYTYEFLGWAKASNQRYVDYAPGKEIKLTQKETFYSITRKTIKIKYTIKDKNALKDTSKASIEKSYYFYNNEFGKDSKKNPTSAWKQTKDYVVPIDDIKALVKENKGYSLSTFNTTNIKNGYVTGIEANTEIKVSTMKQRKVYFYIHDTAHFSFDGSKSILECAEYDSSGQCSLTVPKVKSNDKDHFIASKWVTSTSNGGFSTSAFGLQTNIHLASNGDTVYYLESYDNRPLKATFKTENKVLINNSGSDYTATCYKKNGTSSCNIPAPKASSKISSVTVKGWSIASNKTNINLKFNGTLELDDGNNGIIYYPVYDEAPKVEYTIKFAMNDGNALNKTKTTLVDQPCEVYEGEKCKFKLPSITLNSGYELLGWSDKKGSKDVVYTAGQTIERDKETTLYAITRRTVSIKYVLQDTKAAKIKIMGFNSVSINGNTVNYYTYNGNDTVYAQMADLEEKAGYTSIGWLTEGGTETVDGVVNIKVSGQYPKLSVQKITFGKNSTVTLHSNTRVKDPVVVTFKVVNTKISKKSGGVTTCYKYNGATSCKITAPELTSIDNNYKVDGWSKYEDTESIVLKSSESINLSESTIYYSAAVKKKPYKAMFVIQDTKAATMEKTGPLECNDYNGKGCNVKSPKIKYKSGYVALGWNRSKTATEATLGGDVIFNITDNTYYYSITYNKTLYKATFVIQDNKVASISKNIISCYRYNGASKCEIDSPELKVSSGYSADGWTTKKGEHAVSVLNKGKIKLTKNETTYYSVTSKQVTIKFVIPEKSNVTNKTGTTIEVCNKYNGAIKCSIKAPKLTAESGYEVVGWNTDPNATTALFGSGAKRDFYGDATYYPIVKLKPLKALTATFIIQDSKAATATKKTETCYTTGSSCRVSFPKLTANSGYTAIGWSTSKSSHSGKTVSVKISRNTKFYSITKNNTAISVTFIVTNSSAATKSGGNTTCYKYNGESTCKITAPNLTAKSGYEIVGWNTNKSATGALVKSGGTFSVSKNSIYYSIIKKASSSGDNGGTGTVKKQNQNNNATK